MGCGASTEAPAAAAQHGSKRPAEPVNERREGAPQQAQPLVYVSGAKTPGALASAAAVVVFLTQSYFMKAGGGDAQLQTELQNISKTKPRSAILPVVLEPRLMNPAAWNGPLGSALGGFNTSCHFISSAKSGEPAWEASVALLVSSLQKAMKASAPPLKGPTGSKSPTQSQSPSAWSQAHEHSEGMVTLRQCPSCGRKFAGKAFETHARVCEKVFKTKPKEFDTSRPRTKVNAHAEMSKLDRVSPKANFVQPKWKSDSLQIRSSIQEAKAKAMAARGGPQGAREPQMRF